MRDYIPIKTSNLVLVPALRHESHSGSFVNDCRMMPKTLDAPKTPSNTNISRLIVHGVVILIKWVFQYNIHTLIICDKIIVQLICSGKLCKCSKISSLSSCPS